MDHKSRDVLWHPQSHSLSQVPTEGLEYALLSNKYEQLHQLVWCKDFIQDAIFGFLNNKSVSIFGFKYDPGDCPPVCLTKTKLLLTNFKDEKFGENLLQKVLPFIHAVEDKLKMPHSVIEKCNNPPVKYKKSGVWIITGSRRWMKSPPMISLYTLLIRIGFVHDPTDSIEQTLEKIKDGTTKTYFDNSKRDQTFVKSSISGIMDIFKFTDRKIFPSKIRENYPDKINNKDALSIIHNNSGIVAFATQSITKKNFPQWFKYQGSKKCRKLTEVIPNSPSLKTENPSPPLVLSTAHPMTVSASTATNSITITF